MTTTSDPPSPVPVVAGTPTTRPSPGPGAIAAARPSPAARARASPSAAAAVARPSIGVGAAASANAEAGAGAGDRGGRPGRVPEIHRQARRSLLVAVVFAAAAPVAVWVPHATGGWLPLHLFLVGGLLSAISAATQLFAVTWSASPAPARGAASAQRWILAAGAVAVTLGRELDQRSVTATGGLAVIAALVLLGVNLARIRATAVTDRFAPAIDTHLLAMAIGVIGSVLAVVLVSGSAGSHWASVRDAHLVVNLYGLVGLVIAGTLPWFVATQARTRRSPRATPVRLRALAVALAAATTIAASGQLTRHPGIAGLGLVTYAAGIASIVLLLPVPNRRQLAWAGPRLVQLAAGVVWWAATTLLLAAAIADQRTDTDPILQAMVLGGFAQILVASLAYLGPVLRSGGHEQLAAGFALTGSWTGLIAANTAALGALAGQPAVTTLAVVTWIADTALRALRLAHPRPPTPLRP